MFSTSSPTMLLLSLLALLSTSAAQTTTKCQPLNVTCPPDDALGTSHTFQFNSSTVLDQGFDTTIGTVGFGSQGNEFTVAKKGDMPTVVSKFYIFWGSVSVIMKAAPGQGIISTIVLLSDDLDEVDWEIMGGNLTSAESNYFGKGNTTTYDRAQYHTANSDVTQNFHNYTTHWTSSELQWWLDGTMVRSLAYGDALGGKNYPQTPMTVRLGIWAGGDPDEPKGTIEWAGGVTDYNAGPYTMYVQSATVNDFSTGKQYEYSDHTGDWQSIKVIAGNSTIEQTLNAPPPLTLAQKWKNLPNTTKIAIYAGAGGGAAILFAALLFTCIRARRRGRQERDAYNAKVEQEREEAYQDQIQLREKGMGGWDKKEVATQGEDALGGWGGLPVNEHSKLDGDGASPVHEASPILPEPAAFPLGSTNPFDTRANSPAPSRNMTMTPGSQTRGMNNMTPGSQTRGMNNMTPVSQMRGMNNMTPGSQQQRSMTPGAHSQRTMTPGPQRNMTPGPQRSMTPGSPGPNLVAPQPQRAWNGAPSPRSPGPMSPGPMSPGGASSYGSARSTPMSPNFPLTSPQGQTYGPGNGGYRGGNGGYGGGNGANGGGYGNVRGGYQRF